MRTKTFGARFKALDEAQGVFEALVAVFGNVDRYGDTIVKGAFAGSLERWLTKGRPIPVIFSHQWEDLDAHIGQVLEAKELEEGLYVKAQLDLGEEFAARVWKKMRAGTLAEFSFAFDTLQSAWVDRGEQASPRHVHELRELDLLEVGPCLVGVNPETELIAMKDVGALADLPPEAMKGLLQEVVLDVTKAVLAAVGVAVRNALPGVGEGEAEDEAGGDPPGKSSEHSPSTYALRAAAEMMTWDTE